jgi:hypothetical protein
MEDIDRLTVETRDRMLKEIQALGGGKKTE